MSGGLPNPPWAEEEHFMLELYLRSVDNTSH